MDKSKSSRRYPDYETPDPVPVAPPVGRPRNPTFEERVVQAVRGELWQRRMEEQGLETEEEANDFSIDDDELDPYTPWEAHHDVWEERLMKRKQRAEEEARERAYEAREAAREKRRAERKPPPADRFLDGAVPDVDRSAPSPREGK